jgi:hypothetical protein
MFMPFIKHHFELDHLSGDEQNKIGFLGECMLSVI